MGSRAPNSVTAKAAKLLKLREKLGLNQKDFWGALGVTQSGGSRYEQGRAMPVPVVAELCRVYGDNAATAEEVIKKHKKLVV